ncbi:MAG: hypothetical protein ACHQHN_14550 [Sphingobacteriales bacterium]
MKGFLFIMIAAFSLAACKKSAVTPGLYGKWELRHTMGSIRGFDSTYNTGNGRILQFNSDSSYQQYNNGKLVTQGKFHIRGSNYPTANSLSIFFGESSYENAFILKGDKLQIGMDFDDGVETDYQKMQN